MILQPPSVLIAGPAGSGKSSSIPTMLLTGLKVFVVVTEPGGAESLLDSCTRLKVPVDNLHWTTCLPASAGFSGLENMISSINSMDQKALSDVRDMGKADFRPAAMKVLNALRDFQCERVGMNYGSFTTWDDSAALVLDSLTGLSNIAWGCTVGYKPTANPGEWGIAQNFVKSFLLKINTDRRCFFAMTAHIEKEIDEMSGVKRVMVSTIGAKLAPNVPTFFSEVVLAKKNGDKFLWSTKDASMDTKQRSLPISDTLEPNFVPIVRAYEARKKLAGSAPPPPATTQPVRPSAIVPPAEPMRP